TLIYLLTGIDKNYFNINSSTGLITFKVTPDYETKNTYSLDIHVTDGIATINKNLVINIINLNDNKPVIISNNISSVDENKLLAMTIVVTDSDNDTLIYSINGIDSNYFNINISTGVVVFKESPIYKIKSSYIFIINVSDGINTITQDINLTINNLTVTVQRGNVYGALVKDENNQTATWGISDTNNKLINTYTFTNTIKFPIKVTGGYIDVNQNDEIDTNDTLLDINMSSFSNIVTPITTFFAEANSSEKEKLYQYIDSNFNLDKDKILNTLPTDLNSNNDAVILSNGLYLNIRNNTELNTSIINDIKAKAEDNSTLNQKAMLRFLEEYIVEDKNIFTLKTDDVTSANTKITQLLNPIDLNNSYFNRDVNSTDNIEKIWNFAFDINNSQNISNFDIGIKFTKSTGAIGTILLQNNSISNHIINGPTSMKVYFKSSDGTKSVSKTYDGIRFKPIDNVLVLYNNILMINLANVMLSDDFKSEKERFTAQNSYD
ncbi:MAG: cadherin repeat domain-containing protein, partial [Arcobacteraceae bacterium]|nr:cadherin repeat domain-containing protein [Arcobacteraceae bacterium]